MSSRNKDHDRNAKIVMKAMKIPQNRYCADCNQKQPRWASINLGVFICIRCAGIHRNLGVHISKVRSATLDGWDNNLLAEFQRAQRGGNDEVNKIWEANLPHNAKPEENGSDYNLEQFIRNKYVKKKFLAKPKKNKEKKSSSKRSSSTNNITNNNNNDDEPTITKSSSSSRINNTSSRKSNNNTRSSSTSRINKNKKSTQQQQQQRVIPPQIPENVSIDTNVSDNGIFSDEFAKQFASFINATPSPDPYSPTSDISASSSFDPESLFSINPSSLTSTSSSSPSPQQQQQHNYLADTVVSVPSSSPIDEQTAFALEQQIPNFFQTPGVNSHHSGQKNISKDDILEIFKHKNDFAHKRNQRKSAAAFGGPRPASAPIGSSLKHPAAARPFLGNTHPASNMHSNFGGTYHSPIPQTAPVAIPQAHVNSHHPTYNQYGPPPSAMALPKNTPFPSMSNQQVSLEPYSNTKLQTLSHTATTTKKKDPLEFDWL